MKIAKGLKINDIIVGTGEEVLPKSVVHYSCTCRLTGGDLVFESKDQGLYQTRVGARESFVALDQGLLGMRVGGKRKIKVPPQLSYYERQVYPDLSETTVLYYEVTLHAVVENWDGTLHIRTSPIYSEECKALEKQFRQMTPSFDVQSEYQSLQQKLFKAAEEELKNNNAQKSKIGLQRVVTQEEKTGCGIASVANILGKSYAEMKVIANGKGIYAEDESLWSETDYIRRLLRDEGLEVSNNEIPFKSWESLPDLALLSIKHYQENGKNFWHWVVFKRINGEAYVLDSASYLSSNLRTDFDKMKPKWFIEVQNS